MKIMVGGQVNSVPGWSAKAAGWYSEYSVLIYRADGRWMLVVYLFVLSSGLRNGKQSHVADFGLWNQLIGC